MYRILGTDGKEYGPVGVDQVRQWIAEGRADADTRARAEGEAAWRPLESFPELAAALDPPPAGAGAPGDEGARWTPPGSPLLAVPNYLTQAILVTIFCCLPFGIPAIVFASQVNGKLQMGNLAGARESSRKAKLWCWLSVGGYAVAIVVYGIFALFMIASDGGLG